MDRPLSNTPLQALVLLNDPSYVEAAEALAKQATSPEEIFTRVLSRQPSGAELDTLNELEQSQSKAAVARAVLNLHETITRY